MHGYKGFFADVRNAFANIINEYQPKVTELEDEDFGEYAVKLKFPSCTLVLDLDRDNLQVNIYRTDFNSGEGFDIYAVLDVIRPMWRQEGIGAVSELSSETSRLEVVAWLIDKYLDVVINGDFTWIDAYRKQDRQRKRLVKEVYKLDNDDPIYIKFTKADMTWMDDLKIRLDSGVKGWVVSSYYRIMDFFD